MNEKLLDAYANCIVALSSLTPIEALGILNNLKSSLIKSHNLNEKDTIGISLLKE